jgi:hypothetical protein
VSTLVFVERGGTTTVTQTLLYESRGARDTALESGIDRGVADSYDSLAGVLESLPEAGS